MFIFTTDNQAPRQYRSQDYFLPGWICGEVDRDQVDPGTQATQSAHQGEGGTAAAATQIGCSRSAKSHGGRRCSRGRWGDRGQGHLGRGVGEEGGGWGGTADQG